MKKFSYVLIMCILLSINFNVSAYDEQITNIADGIDLIKIINATKNGNQNITMIRADLNNPKLKLKTLYSTQGAGKLENVETLANSHNAIAAINADFFNYGENGGGSSIGYNVVDGELITTPCTTENVASVAITSTGEFIFDYFDYSGSITNSKGEVTAIKHINKYDDLTGIVLYDKHWGKMSLGATGNLVEVVVVDNIVKEIRKDMPPVEIPQNGYVLAGLSDHTNYLTDKLPVGEKVTLTTHITPDYNIQNVIGGGTILVTDGVEARITHQIAGRNPRSAFGVDKTGKIAYLIAVDGRGAGGSIGMTLEELRTFMINYGIYNGINFDGGGSTQLVAGINGTPAGIVNDVCQLPYRKVSNALGIIYDGGIIPPVNDPNTDPVLEQVDNFETINGSSYSYPDTVKSSYVVTGEKASEGNRSGKLWYDFTTPINDPQAAGFNFVNPPLITYENTEISLDVYGDNSGEWLRYIVTDANGEIHRLDLAERINWTGWKKLTVDVPTDIALPAKITRVYLVQSDVTNKSRGSIYFDNLVKGPGINYTNGKVYISGGILQNTNLITNLANQILKSELDEAANWINLTEDSLDGGTIKKSPLSKTTSNGLTILQLDSITDENLTANIDWLGKQLSGKITTDVIIITDKNPLNNSKYNVPFTNLLNKTDIADKKIYVVYSGAATENKKINNAEYISLPTVAVSVSKNQNTADIAKFFKQGNNYTYEIETFKIW